MGLFELKMPKEFLEIGTWMGRCPANCTPYCPQEQNIARYTGKKVMSFEDFKILTKTVPDYVTYSWAGSTEPFVNPATIAMMEYVQEKGNPQILFTTGIGLKLSDMERLRKITFEWLILHRADRQGHATIPDSPEYRAIIGDLVTSPNILRVECMSMDDETFTSDNNERLFRPEGENIRQKRGRVICDSLTGPQYSLLPNGNLYFCCVTKGLSNVVGSLHEHSYGQLTARHATYSFTLQKNPESVCHKCTRSRPYYLSRISNSPLFGFRDWVNRR